MCSWSGKSALATFHLKFLRSCVKRLPLPGPATGGDHVPVGIDLLECERGAHTLPGPATGGDHVPVGIDLLEYVSASEGLQVFVKGDIHVDRHRRAQSSHAKHKRDDLKTVCEVAFSNPLPQPRNVRSAVKLHEVSTLVEVVYRRKRTATAVRGHGDDPRPHQGVTVDDVRAALLSRLRGSHGDTCDQNGRGYREFRADNLHDYSPLIVERPATA